LGKNWGVFDLSFISDTFKGLGPKKPTRVFLLVFLSLPLLSRRVSLSLSDDDDDGEAALSVLLSSKGGESIRRASTRTQNVLID